MTPRAPRAVSRNVFRELTKTRVSNSGSFRVPFRWASTKVDIAQARGSDYEKRIRSLQEVTELAKCYPRWPPAISRRRMQSIRKLKTKYEQSLEPNGVAPETVEISGRILSRRTAGSRLVFFDIEGNTQHKAEKIQVVCKFDAIIDDVKGEKNFNRGIHHLRPGDVIGVAGHPHKTLRGEFSLLAVDLPSLLAPRLHVLPDEITDEETLSRRSHLRMRLDRKFFQNLQMRSKIEEDLAYLLRRRGMMQVRTPILASAASGAVAQPFETVSKTLSGEKLTMRIAPELYLKRLVVGGISRVFEIGPAFRNEGIDSTHNPEFTICEYYQESARLNDLIRDTEALFADLQSELQLFCTNTGIETPKAASLDGPYTRLSFCSTLNEQIAAKIPNFVLPDLSSPTAAEDLQSVYHQMNISLPSNLALPQLLDDLCKRFIEPLCEKPTWVIHHPAVLSPLAKSFTADDGQQVSARAELFVNGQEIVNCYEEENNPLEQRKKFLQQQEFHNRADDDEVPIGASSGFTSGIDESYIEALEWGMPPTGGWGCGVDRLVMLLTGASNIKDTLPFGNLRNVAAMGKPWRT